MKVTYELSSADLKVAIEAWMAARGTPVTDADAFSVEPDGSVTIVVTSSAPSPNLVQNGTKLVVAPPAVAVPSPGHMVQVDPPLSVTGPATEFGYKDPTDNGLGFFFDPATNKPYATNNDVIRGVSLPREVMLSTFLKIDSWKTDGVDAVWSYYGSMLRQWVDGNKPRVTIDSGGKSASDLPIVDAGPTAGTGNCIDLTGAITKELGTNGKALATYEIIVHGKPIPIRGWDFTKGQVG
jgi:hypothetical protein